MSHLPTYYLCLFIRLRAGNNILNPDSHCDQIIPLFGSHFKLQAVSWYMPKNPVGHHGWGRKKILQFRSSKTVFPTIFHNILFKNIAFFYSKFHSLTLKKPSFSQCVLIQVKV